MAQMTSRLALLFRPRPNERRSHAAARALAMALLGLSLATLGCQPKTIERPANPAPAPLYAGPEYLRGTVGSMASLRNYEPLLVSGYGLVVGLDGTGSEEVPAFLRQDMINRLRQMGVGSTRVRRNLPEHLQAFGRMTPEQLLASRNTAIVAVQGFLPPGAVRGSRFDVLVSALPQTQTTSLAGGVLWTTELGIDGTNPALPFTRTRAEARGPIYINPFDDESDEQDKSRFLRQAVVVGGGRVTLPQQIELVLNQPSWTRSARIADRINERFPAGPGARQQTASAQTQLIINLNIPQRYAAQPDALLELIAHLYIQRGPDFETEQAERLARRLREDESRADRIVLAWRGLGRTIIPVLRSYYTDDMEHLRLAALEAGAWLQDERAGLALSKMSEHATSAVRQRVAEALVHLPRSVAGSQALQKLLSDNEPAVRIAAYESLASINDPAVERLVISDRNGDLKLAIDRVDADSPMLYITQEHFPRLVIFDKQLGFRTPLFAQMWDSRLMVRAEEPDEPLNVYYQRPGTIEGQMIDNVWPSVAALAYLMANRPGVETGEHGFDMTYSQVIETIYHMARNGDIPAPIELNISPLAQRVAEYESVADTLRPDVSDDTPEPVVGPEPAIDTGWLNRPGQPGLDNSAFDPLMSRPRIENHGQPDKIENPEIETNPNPRPSNENTPETPDLRRPEN